MTTYKEYFASLPLGAAMKGTYGRMWTDGLAQHLDDMLQDTIDSVEAAWPDYAAAAGDDYALGLIGSDCLIKRYPAETDAQYGERVRTPFTKWAKAGTSAAITEDLEGIGYSSISYILNADWAPSPPDGNTTWWSRFWVVIQGHPFTAPLYGGADTYGGGKRYGGDFSADDIATLKAIVKQWKPAHSYCEAIVIAYSVNILPVGKAVAGFAVGNDAAYLPMGE